MMASVRERNGKFTGLYRDGQGRQKSAGTFPTSEEALARATVAELDANPPTSEEVYATSKRGRVTVAAYGPQWLATARLEPTSRESYGNSLKHVIRHLGSYAVADVGADHIRKMFRALEKTHAAATVGSVRTVASEMFKSAVLDKIRDDNPVAGVKIASRETRR